MNHLVVQVGTKFHFRDFLISQTIASIYVFRNAGNGCWGTYFHTNYDNDYKLDDFILDYESGKIIIEEQPNA
jgi:hypothetical protein